MLCPRAASAPFFARLCKRIFKAVGSPLRAAATANVVRTGGDSAQGIQADGDLTDVADLALDDADRAALEYLAGLRFGGPIVAGPVSALPVEVVGVTIPAGWSRDHWREELLRLADRCSIVRPDRAAELRADAKRLAES